MSRAILTGIALTATLAASCNPNGSSISRELPQCGVAQLITEADPQADPGPLRLLACPLRSRAEPGDPVKVLVVLQNVSSSRVHVRARLFFADDLFAEVVSADGTAVRFNSDWEPGHVGRSAEFSLPYLGFVGRVVGLACDARPSGPGQPPSWEQGICEPAYDFRQEGTYRVTLQYGVECVPGECPPDHPWVGVVEARPFEILVGPAAA